MLINVTGTLYIDVSRTCPSKACKVPMTVLLAVYTPLGIRGKKKWIFRKMVNIDMLHGDRMSKQI